jgi:hypothetical protein
MEANGGPATNRARYAARVTCVGRRAVRVCGMRLAPQLRILVATVGVGALLSGCGSDGEPPTTSSLEPKSADATSTASSDTASRLEGTWRTSPITLREVDATLRRHGLGKWKGRFRSVTPLRSTTTLILDIKDGEWDLYGQTGSGPREAIDYDAEYDVKGDNVQKIHATGVTTYGWSVNDDDTLMFEWIGTTEPRFEGIPDEVFSRVLYMTQPFKRQT